MTPLDIMLWAIAVVIAAAALLAASIGVYLVVIVIRATIKRARHSGGES